MKASNYNDVRAFNVFEWTVAISYKKSQNILKMIVGALLNVKQLKWS